MWGKALNGDFYKGVVTGLGEMLHIKFDNGDTIAHDRSDPECIVFDQTPEVSDLEVGKSTLFITFEKFGDFSMRMTITASLFLRMIVSIVLCCDERPSWFYTCRGRGGGRGERAGVGVYNVTTPPTSWNGYS